MRFKRIWRGKFPKYWDVTNWVILLPRYVVFCHRSELTNRRTVARIEIDSGDTKTVQIIYNTILGWRNRNIFLARVSDARSHLLIDRIGAFDVNRMTFDWEISESILVEKYKLPVINENSVDWCVMGNKKIDLSHGHLSTFKQIFDYRWLVDKQLSLVQRNDILCCIDTEGKEFWAHQGFFGSYFQGAIGKQIIFYTPQNEVIILDKMTGALIENVNLLEVRSVTRRIFGNFELSNELSYENTTIADGLINESIIVWINETNAIMIENRVTKTVQSFSYPNTSIPYLSQINKTNLLMYELEDEDYGSLLIGTLEE